MCVVSARGYKVIFPRYHRLSREERRSERRPREDRSSRARENGKASRARKFPRVSVTPGLRDFSTASRWRLSFPFFSSFFSFVNTRS